MKDKPSGVKSECSPNDRMYDYKEEAIRFTPSDTAFQSVDGYEKL